VNTEGPLLEQWTCSSGLEESERGSTQAISRKTYG